MSITDIENVSQLDRILGQSKEKLSVIDFHATWCGPCHAIAPKYSALSTSSQFKNVNFLRCDVDAAKDVASRYRVSSMPTFLFLKGDVIVDKVVGADRAGLDNALSRHSSPSSASSGVFTGKGQTLGGAIVSPSVADTVRGTSHSAIAGVTNLDPQVKVLLGLLGLYAVFWWLG